MATHAARTETTQLPPLHFLLLSTFHSLSSSFSVWERLLPVVFLLREMKRSQGSYWTPSISTGGKSASWHLELIIKAFPVLPSPLCQLYFLMLMLYLNFVSFVISLPQYCPVMVDTRLGVCQLFNCLCDNFSSSSIRCILSLNNVHLFKDSSIYLERLVWTGGALRIHWQSCRWILGGE